MPWVIMCNGNPTRPRTAPGPSLSPASADVDRKTVKPATAMILKVAWPVTAWFMTILRTTAKQYNDRTADEFRWLAPDAPRKGTVAAGGTSAPPALGAVDEHP